METSFLMYYLCGIKGAAQLGKLGEKFMNTQQLISSFNKPYQTAVAINCAAIGDDNDYSCFLDRVIVALYNSGNQDLALIMANTDPLLINPYDADSLSERMIKHAAFIEEQNATKALYDKLYKD